jgi:hypothetical protein
VARTVTVCGELTLAGAVYSPAADIDPTFGEIDHVTAVFPVLITAAVNCCVPEAYRAADPGLTLTAIGGINVIVAVPVALPSSWLVAVNVTVCCAGTVAGAVYRPLTETVPNAGDRVQVTFGLPAFVTVAPNCCVWPWYSSALSGPTETIIGGFSVTVATAVFDGSATLVTLTATVCCAEMMAGAVYRPDGLTVPIADGTAQIKPVLTAPLSSAVNCCVWLERSVAEVGEISSVTGISVTAAVALRVGPIWLVAVTVTVCGSEIVAGAVYSPAGLIAPTAGDIVQVTPVSPLPVTVAVNWAVPFALSVCGACGIVTFTGTRFTVAAALRAGSATLVAVTVTACGAVIPAGAG